MVEDTPDDLVHELFTQHFWEGHALGRPILGSKETVESFTGDVAARLFPRRLRRAEPDHLGGRQPRARARARPRRAAFGARSSRAASARRTASAAVVPQVLMRTKELEQSHVCLGTNSYPQNHDDRYVSYIMNTVLGGSMSSRLFQNVREKRGLAYAVFSGLSAYRDAGNITIYAGCANEAVDEVIDLCVEELRGMKQAPVPDAELRARQGSSQGQPDAEPREHGQPDVAPGAAGDLLRAALRSRRDARRRRAGDRRTTCSGSRAICSRTDRWPRRCSGRRRRRCRARSWIWAEKRRGFRDRSAGAASYGRLAMS